MGIRGAAVVAALCVGALLVTGCGPYETTKLGGPPIERSALSSDRALGLPAEADGITMDLTDPEPLIVWADNGEDWLVVTWGSTSCPYAPTSVAESAPGEFTITLEPEIASVCTADDGATTFRFPAPDGVHPGDAVVVDLGPGIRRELG